VRPVLRSSLAIQEEPLVEAANVAMSLKRYEYKIIDPALWRSGDTGAAGITQIEEQLNRLGREGWEIVGVVGGDVADERGLCLAKRKVKTHHKKAGDAE
jgi:hypothetical protein